jgi:hypothetical protein
MKKINLFWCNILNLNNFGDMLSPIIVEKLSGQRVRFTDRSFMQNTVHTNLVSVFVYLKKLQFKRIIKLFSGHYTRKIMAVGSIINCSDKRTVVWGAGIIKRNDIIENGHFVAVRGPLTQERLKNLGFNVPKVVGDPALLLRKLFQCNNPGKCYKFGLIPHHSEYEEISQNIHDYDYNNILLINLRDDPFKIIKQISSCERIFSSSLHGLIVAHTYSIPAVWCEFSNNLGGDGSKFEDYFLSVNHPTYTPLKAEIKDLIDNLEFYFMKYSDVSLPSSERIDEICRDLLSVAPFSINRKNIIQ